MTKREYRSKCRRVAHLKRKRRFKDAGIELRKLQSSVHAALAEGK